MLRRGAGVWKAAIALGRRCRRRIRTRRALSQLDVRTLDDVGLSREQRNRECAKWFWER
jgi:uncharacterized protein YjiS (DUF1127 family)